MQKRTAAGGEMISEKYLQEELKESEALLHQMFQLSPMAIYRIDLVNQCFIKVNDVMCRTTGYSEKELMAKKPEELLTPPSRRLFYDRMAAVAKGLPVAGTVDFELQKKNGEVEWGRFHIRHLFEKGKITAANVVAHIITEQKKAQEELIRYRKKLEIRVKTRTSALTSANQRLKHEIEKRTQVAEELRQKTNRMEEMNTAMRVLLDKHKEDCLRVEEITRLKLHQLIKPYLDKLDSTRMNNCQKQLLNAIRANFEEAVYSPISDFNSRYTVLSPNELKVANFIHKGKTTKEIASLLFVSERTVESYRNSIRKKLGLKNKKINLNTYLSSW